MLLKAERREVDAISEDTSLGQNANTPNAINLHLHIRVTIGVPKVSQMRTPGGILRIAFDNHGILVQRIGQRQGCFGLLPGVQIVGLLSAQPVG